MLEDRRGIWTVVGAAVISIAASEGARESDAIDFRRDVRPVLAASCFPCHGPDAGARRANLRLDTREGAAAVLTAGDADTSELFRRITSADLDERMPPPDFAHELDVEEIELLERWIDSGAEWQQHWAYVPPVRPTHSNSDSEWTRDPLDEFVLARLESEGLEPSQEADRATLLRRLSFDLVGLPPTLEELDAFLADESAGAYERAVDRLLASPHYGERMALPWLDLARYADTNGYSIDGGRHMWAWRDWVIDAFNANKPYDEFTIEQLAGDLLPDADLDTRIASGFNRNHMITHEGGTIEEEYRVAYVVDRVKTTAQAWMGMTMGCAQCHDHKYDPVSQREFYRFFAYFNNITDRGNDGNGGKNSVPFLPVPTPSDRRELQRLQLELNAVERELKESANVDPAKRAAWEREVLARALAQPTPTLGSWFASAPFSAASGDEAFDHAFAPEREHTTMLLDAQASPEFVEIDEGTESVAVEWTERADLVDGVSHALSGQNTAHYLTRTITSERAGVVILSLGSDDAIQLWHDGERVLSNRTQRGVAPDQETVRLSLREGKNRLLLKIVNYGGPGGFYFDLKGVGPGEVLEKLLGKSDEERSAEERRLLDQFYIENAEVLAPLRTRLASLRLAVDEIEARAMTTVMVMEELDEPRRTYVLDRGQYDQRGERVEPGTPECLPAMPDDARSDRLGLARWLVDPAHPLTARVAVNRFWQMLFGTGLVETSEDFGTQGAWPSHPEVLDYLALEFVESGWDVKALVRRIARSATYRQDSRVTPELRERDPNNRLLARGPRFRLQAELVRDNALAIAGLLVRDIGGRSVKPYQPEGLWLEMSHFGSTPATEQVYEQGSGEDLYRRGLYTVLKRTVPPPSLAAFDAPNREFCVSRRLRTNTPLQALVTLNDPTYVEAARAFARRMLIEGGDSTRTRLSFGVRLATSRVPDEAMLSVLERAVERELRTFEGDEGAALELLAVGDSARDESLEPTEHAAWTVVASTLLNLSQTITRD